MTDGALSHEDLRVELQRRQDATKLQAERNRLGQFATPPSLALDMLTFAKGLIPASTPIRFLEPGFGTGAFYSALLRTFAPEEVRSALGFESDPHYGLPATELWASTGLELRVADFTRATPPTAEAEKANLIVCNPPYVRHHHLPSQEKARLRDAVRRASGVRVPGLAGLYCYFMGVAHAWLADQGLAGWLVPSEFMDVNYGTAIKHYLLEQVTLLRVHRFDPETLQFDDALVSSTVVWFRKAKPTGDHRIEFSWGGTLGRPDTVKALSTAEVTADQKWSQLRREVPHPEQSVLTLGQLFSIKRGIATGGNRFFILTEDEIGSRSLPLDQFRPILPGPRYITNDEILADARGNPVLPRRLFLLDCRLPEVQIRDRYPTLWEYLEAGRDKIATRYLCSHRSPWYAQEQRPPAPFLCTYMARKGAKDGRSFRFLLNRSRATAANVYLLLYPRPVLRDVLAATPGLSRQVWEALNAIGTQDLHGEGRVYGGGLHKMEPAELANVAVGHIAALLAPLGEAATWAADAEPLPSQLSLAL